MISDLTTDGTSRAGQHTRAVYHWRVGRDLGSHRHDQLRRRTRGNGRGAGRHASSSPVIVDAGRRCVGRFPRQAVGHCQLSTGVIVEICGRREVYRGLRTDHSSCRGRTNHDTADLGVTRTTAG